VMSGLQHSSAHMRVPSAAESVSDRVGQVVCHDQAMAGFACLLSSGLYRRPWNFPRSCRTSLKAPLAGSTADRELADVPPHPAPKAHIALCPHHTTHGQPGKGCASAGELGVLEAVWTHVR
jgi:hypothetical protein